jgi:hypothetical protein
VIAGQHHPPSVVTQTAGAFLFSATDATMTPVTTARPMKTRWTGTNELID